MRPCAYLTRRSRFGDFAVVWREDDGGPAIVRVLLRWHYRRETKRGRR